MSYEFGYNPKDFIEIRQFEYKMENAEYRQFSYFRDIRSDLSKFNAPVFMEKEDKGVFFAGTPGLEREAYGIPWLLPEISMKFTGRPMTPPDAPESLVRDRYGFSIGDRFKALYGPRKGIRIDSNGTGVYKSGNAMGIYVTELLGIMSKPVSFDSCRSMWGHIRKGISYDKNIPVTEINNMWYQDDGLHMSLPFRKSVNVWEIIGAIREISVNILKYEIIQKRIYQGQWWEGFYLAKETYPYLASKFGNIFVKKITDAFVLKEIAVSKAAKYTDTALFKPVRGGAVAYRTSLDKDYSKIICKPSPFPAYIRDSFPVFRNHTYNVDANRIVIAEKHDYIANINKAIAAEPERVRKAYRFTVLEMYKAVHKGVMDEGFKAFIKSRKKSFMKQDIRCIRRTLKNIVKSTGFKGAWRDGHEALKSKIISVHKELSKHGFYVPEAFLTKPGHKAMTGNTYIWLYKGMQKRLSIQSGYTGAYKERLHLFTSDDYAGMIKDSAPMMAADTEKFLYHDLLNLHLRQYEKHLHRYRHGTDINNTEKHLFRDPAKMMPLITEEFLYKETYPFRVNDTEAFLHRERYEMQLKDYCKSLFRKRHKMFPAETEVHIHREKYGIWEPDYTAHLSRMRIPIDDALYEKWLYRSRYEFQFDIGNASLMRKAYLAFTDDNNEFLYRNPYEAFISASPWLYREPKYSDKNDTEKTLERIMLNAFRDNKDEFLKKKAKDMFTHEGEWLKGSLRYVYEFHQYMLYKKHKNLFLKEIISAQGFSRELSVPKQVWMKGFPKEMFITPGKWGETGSKRVWTERDKWLTGFSKDMDVYKQVSAITFSKELNIFKSDSWAATFRKGAMGIWSSIWLEKEISAWTGGELFVKGGSRSIWTEDSIKGMSLKSRHMEIMDVLLKMDKKDAEITVNEILRMEAFVKEMEKPVEKTFNWAWVYTPDNPLQQEEVYHGLDELLLPERDVDYSKFEDYIFNKSKLVPRNPVEIIDETTFIAKLPIKHPTPKYEEVGIVYLDVRSELMYKIFCRYYEIWYANVYKFGNMTMVDSLRLMLDYMYSWIILEYSGTEYFDEALRVFRQIRWFGEKSVMQNSQYIVHYDRADLKCSMKDGILKEIDNDIGANGFVIRKDLNAIAADSDRYRTDIEMNLNLKVKFDTEIAFNVSQAGGSLRIRLDGMLVENIDRSVTKVRIPVPEGSHVLQFTRSAGNNTASCYIGNITLKDCGFKNLEITYDPKLMLGNMPLDDVAKKMMELALIYDENADAFERYREGNLAVSELHKELLRYWRLHHENKIKGKRLTIKEAGI